jgi:hypothetical protein
MRRLNRAQFIASLAGVGAVALGIEACGDDGGSGSGEGGSNGSNGNGGDGATNGSGSGASGTASTTGSGGAGTTSGSTSGAGGGSGETCSQAIDAQITCRHDHRMLVPVADIIAGVDQTYDIQGANATHGHNVTVTAAMFAALRRGETVDIFVPSDFQQHTVYLSCAGLDPNELDNQGCN